MILPINSDLRWNVSSFQVCSRFARLAIACYVIGIPTAAAVADPKDEAAQYHKRGAESYRAGDLAAAEKAFRQAVAIQADDVRYRNDLALLLMKTGRIDQALPIYKKSALTLFPDDPVARHRYAIALNQARLVAEAGRQLQIALQLDARQAVVRRDLLRILVAQGDLMQAIQVATEGIDLHPHDADLRNDLGVVLMKVGKHDAAEQEFRRAIVADETHADAHYNLGVIYTNRWELTAAAAELRRALDLIPRYADAQFQLGEVYDRAGETEEARSAYQQTIAIRKSYAPAYFGLGRLALREGDHREAIRQLTEALRHNPGLGRAKHYLGIAFLDAGRANLALPQLMAALNELPTDPDVNFDTGRALEAVGNKKHALARYREAVWLRPSWDAVKNAISELERGDVGAQ